MALATTGLTGCGTPGVAPTETAYAYPALRAVMERLERGEPTTVAFFGGSITWGATATDPLRTSWRALVEADLRQRHPRTPLTAVDAAIGGQPSRLGVFRMERDVLPYAPHLCFVEFAVNDWRAPDNQETIEGIIRKLRACRPDMAIVLVLIGSNPAYDRSPAQDGQMELAAHYGLPVIDIYAAVKARLADGLTTRDILTDGTHPNDRGYRIYADIVLERLNALRLQTGTPPAAPAGPLTANRYESARMLELTKLGSHPGWDAGTPAVEGTWFDHTPSRWHDSTLRPLAAGARLEVEREVTGAGLYFERIPQGKPLRLLVDDAAHLEIPTSNDLQFARVHSAFKWLEKPGHRLTLEAPEGGPAAAAYLLITTRHPETALRADVQVGRVGAEPSR
jgi:lysophospholipase L1-like esterase